ncbi:MAG TPA: DUF4145 domain-containing protein [Candidatus Binatia bacterium]|nr:DUF4145 domain-containing protein [Candidatus Binatia bacterium]
MPVLSTRASVEVVKANNHSRTIACGECGRETLHRELTRVKFDDHSPDYEVRIWGLCLTVQCQGCGTVNFVEETYCSEHESYSEDGKTEFVPTYYYYPGRIAGRAELRSVWELPAQVREIYQEAHAALCNKQLILAGIGIRAIVETVCKRKRAVGGNLKQRINDLVNKGVVGRDGAAILQRLRIMGNRAAHEVKPHTEDELSTAFEVAEHLLQGAFLIPKKAATLRRRRA